MSTATKEPTRLKASDFPREVLTLFDRYVHGMIDRRAFLDGAREMRAGRFGFVRDMASVGELHAAFVE